MPDIEERADGFANGVERLRYVQKNLRAPKGQFNKFGGYKYRSCEDILEAVKPLLAEAGLVLVISDRIEHIEGRFYVEATATVYDGKGGIMTATAYAREDDAKKGMDAAQVTGSASSYARKYALNGLFAIDDAKDPDATNDHGKGARATAQPKAATPPKPARDYSALVSAASRLAEIHGTDPQDEKRWIVKQFGNPNGMDEEQYTALLASLDAMIQNDKRG